jgi:putative transposase
VFRDLVGDGTATSLAVVRRVMREQRLHGTSPRRYRVTTIRDAGASAAPDLLERDFASSEPGAKLVGDITYLRTWNGWGYLAVVIDTATRRVVGWQLGSRADAALCSGALEMASRNGHLAVDAIFHTDRGSTYTAAAFAATCRRLRVRKSMGRTGVCWDNAM